MGIGEGIAFAALVIGTVFLEWKGFPVSGLWIVIVIWALLTDWGQKKE